VLDIWKLSLQYLNNVTILRPSRDDPQSKYFSHEIDLSIPGGATAIVSTPSDLVKFIPP
jgi:hypothetical protein